jgi:hypothetical protein
MEIGTGVLKWDAIGELVAAKGFVVTLETSGFRDDREEVCVRSLGVLRDLWG